MSYKYEIKVFGDPKWYSNQLMFATKQEASTAGLNKFSAWSLAEDW